MTRYLLDTNIVSNLIQFPQGIVARTIAQVSEANIVTSIIVACELRYGVARRGSPSLAQRVEQALDLMPILSFDAGADVAYAAIRADLDRRGMPIGNNDLLIAAHAMAAGTTLVSDNVREFERVGGLRLQNWLR